MENFIVSARKYRPATFDTVVGQHSITNTLKNAIRSNQLAQAFLFCGPRGVGKTTCARILAKTINCTNISENIEPCNECESCKSFSRSASFNIYELDAASNNSVDDIRSLVDQVRIPPQTGKYKVYIIDEVHMLSLQAFNAFLKTLEEPPAYAKFILATTEKHKIIPTILSRCQIFDFKRITVNDIVNHLEFVAKSENVEAERDALHIIAVKADGSLRDSLSIFDQLVSFSGDVLSYKTVIENLNILDYDYYFRMTDHLLQGDYASSIKLLNDILYHGFDGQHFLTGLAEHMRNLLVSKDPSTIELLTVAESHGSSYQKQAAAASPKFLFSTLEKLNNYDINYKAANSKNLHLEICMLEICSGQMEEQGEGFKKKIPPAPEIAPVPAPAPAVKANPEPVITREKKEEYKPQKNGNGIATLSIKNGGRDIKAGEIVRETEEDGTENLPETEFSEEKLRDAWKIYSESVSEKNPHLFATLTKHIPVLSDKNVIIFQVDNKVQQEEIKNNRSDLLRYLRNEMVNGKIQLETKVIKATADSKPYTPQERYRHMLKKTPDLKFFKDELDLDIDY